MQSQWTNADRRALAGYLAMVNDGYVTVVPASPIISAGDRVMRGLLSFASGLVGTLLLCATICALVILVAAVARP